MKKILIVEDEPVLLLAIKYKLNKEGFHVIEAQNGKQAMAEFELVKPDLVITDVMMPFSSGLELLSWIKNLKSRNIPVIVLSKINKESNILEAFNLGADEYMTKPFSPNELIVRIQKLI